MDTSQTKQSASSFTSVVWSWLLGSWFLNYLVAGSPVPVAGLAAIISLIFAFFFLYTWSLSASVNRQRFQKLQAKRGHRIALSVVEALTILWSATGLGALVVWFWMVDLEQVAGKAMQQAHEKIPLIFWLAIAGAVIIGGWLSFLTILAAVKAESVANNDSEIQPEKASPGED